MTTNDYCFDLNETPENILANKIKEDVIDKLLTCETKEQIQDALNSIISDNYDSLSIEELRTGPAPIGPILDSFVACALEESNENLNNTQITIADLLKNAIDLVCNPPAFNIPAPYPVVDISNEFLKQLLLSLLRLVIKILMSILKKLLMLIIDICSANFDFGSQNILQSIAESVTGGIDEATNFINDTFAIFGIDANGVPSTAIIEGQGCEEPVSIEAVKTTTQFLDDLSSVLTPTEICNFFENIPTEQSFQVVEELMKFEYPAMAAVFNDRTKIRQLFKILGKRVDPKICQIIRDNADKITSAPELCFTQDGNEIRRNFLKKRDLTDEEIEKLLEKERDRQKDNLEKVANLLASVKNDPNKLFGDKQDIFCKNGQPGIVTIEQMPSLQDNLSRATNYIFNIFATTYSKEISSYQSSLLYQDKTLNTKAPVIQKFVNLSVVDKDGAVQVVENSINSVFMQRTSFGTFELCDKSGNTDSDSLSSFYAGAKGEDGNVDVNKVISQTNVKDLKSNVGSDNIYIKNYNIKEAIAPEFFNETYGLAHTGSAASRRGAAYKFLGELFSYDIEQMSISINLPTKFSPFGQATTEPDYKTIESTDNIVVYVEGKEE